MAFIARHASSTCFSRLIAATTGDDKRLDGTARPQPSAGLICVVPGRTFVPHDVFADGDAYADNGATHGGRVACAMDVLGFTSSEIGIHHATLAGLGERSECSQASAARSVPQGKPV